MSSTRSASLPGVVSTAAVAVGSRVTVGAGATLKRGVVAFVGETEFAAGEWIGILLDSPDGKNDGSVAGVRYFACEAAHGLFVKRAQVKLDKDAPVAQPAISVVGSIGAPISIGPLPSTLAADSAAEGGDGIPASVAGAKQAANETNVRNEPKGGGSETRLETHDASTAVGTDLPPPQSSHSEPEAVKLSISTAEERVIQMEKEITSLQRDLAVAHKEVHLLRAKDKAASESSSAAAMTVVAEREEAEARWRAREGDLRAEIARLRADAATHVGMEHKSSAEFESLSARVQELEGMVSEYEDTIEALTLDKEQLSLEAELLEEKYSQMLAEMRPSAGASMERAVEGGEDTLAQIDRLKEALRRLQTVSSREIQELKEKVESLSASNYAANLRLRELEHVELKCVSLAAELSVSQSEVRDLSQMVDAASASEELVERLTNENFSLGQQLVQLKTVVSDLEASAELSEELDASQRAEIVALRRDIELKDLHISNMLIEGKNARARLDESNRMIEKLRSTVASLQDSLRSLQAEASAVLDDNKNEAAVRAKQRLMRLNQSNLVLFQNCAELNGKLICLNSSVIECKSRIECLEAVLPTSLERDSSIQSRIAMLIRFQSVDANIRSAQGVCVASLSMLRRLLDVFGLKFCSSIFDSLSDVIDSSHNPLMVMTSKNFQSDSTSAIKKMFILRVYIDIVRGILVCFRADKVARILSSSIFSDGAAPRQLSESALRCEDALLSLRGSISAFQYVLESSTIPLLIKLSLCLGMDPVVPASESIYFSRSLDAANVSPAQLIEAGQLVEIELTACEKRVGLCEALMEDLAPSSLEQDAILRDTALSVIAIDCAQISVAGMEEVCKMYSVSSSVDLVETDATPALGDSPLTAKWYSSAIANILNRVRSSLDLYNVIAAHRERSVLALLQLQTSSAQCVDGIIGSMAKEQELAAAAAVDDPGVTCDTDSLMKSAAGAAYEGLKEAYLKVQDLPTTLALVDDGDSSNPLAALLDSNERNHFIKLATELKQDLCELIQSHKSGSRLVQEKDDLFRSHAALENELRFVRSRLAEAELALRRKPSASASSAAAAAATTIAGDSPTAASKQAQATSNRDAAPVDVEQSDSQVAPSTVALSPGNQPSSGSANIGASSKVDRSPLSGQSNCTNAEVEWAASLLEQVGAWRGLACRRLLAPALLAPLPPVRERNTQFVPAFGNNLSDSGKDVLLVYRELRRQRARSRVLEIATSQ